MLHLSFWALVAVTLGLTHVTIAAVTIYLHRCQAHRALDVHPAVAHFFRAWLWLTTGMSTREWAAVHRLHHARCETEDDPHSPQVKGLATVFFKGVALYRAAARNPDTLKRFSHGTPNDWLEKNLYQRLNWLGLLLMATVDIALFGLPGIAVWLVQAIWIPLWAAGVINGVAHAWGYRNFDAPDAARNIFPWGILIGGEELHNNHHAYATSAKLSVKPYEFDLGWLYIRLLQALGLATVKKIAPQAAWSDVASDANESLLAHIVAHRFEVMSKFAAELRELHHRECAGATLSRMRPGIWKRLQVLHLSPADQAELQRTREQSDTLRKALELRDELIQVWTEKAATRAESVERLKAWFTKAEASGIKEMQRLCARLRRLRTA
jgi:stearoyl-CoA desaturase (delta-9 desaturase)